MGTLQFLKIRYVLLGILLLPLLLADSDLQGKDALEHKSPPIASHNGSKKGNEEQNVGVNSGSNDPTIVAPKKNENEVENPTKVAKKDVPKNDISKPLDSKDNTVKFSEGNSNVESSNKGYQSNKQVKNTRKENDNSQQAIKEGKNSGKSVNSNVQHTKDGDRESSDWMKVKEKSRDEECDPSNMCVDKKNNLTACLRVPGNDLPDLSLQIWNKGTKAVNISITAPAFVQLEESKVQLQPKEDKKVKVSISYEGMDTDSIIFLTTNDNNCTLDFKELVPHDSSVETRYSFKLRYLTNWTKIHLIIFLTLSSFSVFGCAWMYFGLRKKLIFRNGYRAVETELPVSAVPKKTVSEETSGGWDDSWDDNWDDAEAPVTPTLPVTPNLSSRGLASRRLSKEAWKD